MVILILMAIFVWFAWGAMFDPEDKKGPIERTIRHPRRETRKRFTRWIDEAEEILNDPSRSIEDRRKAIEDITFFTKWSERI